MKRSILYFLFTLLIWLPASLALGTDLDISPEFLIATGLTSANSNTESPGKPGIGFDGVNYLVVTCRENDSSDNIEGLLVSTEGAIVTSFPIAELNPIYGCGTRISVAFDGSNYLVIFSQVTSTGNGEIVGARITPTGTVLDGPSGFTIFQDAPFTSAVAFDGSNYLVVSVSFNTTTLHDIIGARVNPDGQVLDEFPIFTAPGGQAFPSIAFDGINYLVIWSDTRSGSPIGPDADIYGTRVSPEGLVLDPGGIPISTALGIQGFNDVTFDGVNYFAVWDDGRNGPGIFDPIRDIYGTRLTPDGVLLDGPPETGGIAISTHPRPQDKPVVSFNGTEYFVAWEMSYFLDPPEGIFAARVSTDGFLIDGPPDTGGILISEPDTSDFKLVWPNSHFNGSNVLLAWTNNRELGGTFKDVVGVLISHTSDILDVQINIKLGSNVNPINLKSKGNIPVAILTTEDFDATTVDPETVRFGVGLAREKHSVGHIEDVDTDGDNDVVYHFPTQDSGIQCGDTTATLTGRTFDGQSIMGSDSIVTQGCK